jgi:exoribonuclease R
MMSGKNWMETVKSYVATKMAGFLFTKDYVHFQIKTVFGEIITEFTGANKAGKALPGDQVVWDPELQICKIQIRNRHYPIVGVLEITSKTKYGMTSRNVPMYLFTPCRKEYPPMVVGCSERNAKSDLYVSVDFQSWDTTSLPRGNLRSIIGICGNPVHEREALRLTFNPFKIPKDIKNFEITECISKYDRTPCPSLTFNIDPEGCKDIDDVLSIHETETEFYLWITISDVAEIVEPCSPIDEFASLQASTCYENGNAVIPMLPFTYSEGCCSLLPGKLRFGISLVLSYNKNDFSKFTRADWKLSTVCNKKQFTYENFCNLAPTENIPVNSLKKIATGILNYESDDPHKWIEAFMLIYNFNAAKLLQSEKRGVLRKHSAPDIIQLQKYKEFGIPELEVLANKSAQYCQAKDTNTIHYGLNTDVYCHATSPIRRYADLLNQRVIKDILLKTSTSVCPDIVWLNERQKDLKRFERDLFLLNKISLNKKGITQALILEIKNNNKYKLWFPEWKRIMTWKPVFDILIELKEAQTIQLSYYANPQVRNWKDKIVFRFENIVN